MRVGFIGLGNVGSKLAGSLLRNGFDLAVRDLDRSAAAALEAGGAGWADSPAEMAAEADMVITCLPSPGASAAVMEAGDGILAGLASRAGRGDGAGSPIWAEMSTTDEAEVRRLAALELSPVLIDVFDDAAARYGPGEWSPNVIRRLEEAVGTKILAPGFPPEMLDDEPEAPGREVVVHRG